MESITVYAQFRLVLSWYNNDNLELNKGDKITFFSEDNLIEVNNVKRNLGPGCFTFNKTHACAKCKYFDNNPYLPCSINPDSAKAGLTCNLFEDSNEEILSKSIVITNCLIRMDGLSCRTNPDFATLFSTEKIIM